MTGIDVVRLSDATGSVTALIAPAVGSNLFSLKVCGRELLRSAPDADALRTRPTSCGIPVLMPPNRIAGGRFRFAGREYRFPINSRVGHHIHGLVVGKPWTVEAAESGRAVLAFHSASQPELTAWFPHPFVLRLTYTLARDRLRCESEVRNDGDSAMPFGLGFHPYLATPGGGGSWEVRLVAAARRWELRDMLPTGRFVKAEGAWDLGHWQPVHSVSRDDGYSLDNPSLGSNECELRDRATDFRLAVRADGGFSHWVIFTGPPGSREFVCLEPYTCMTNAFNLSLPTDVSGLVSVPPRAARQPGAWEIVWGSATAD